MTTTASSTKTSHRRQAGASSTLRMPGGTDLAPVRRDEWLDPSTLQLWPGDQHPMGDTDGLRKSIASKGQMHPIQVVELDANHRYISAGRHRWKAAMDGGFYVRCDVWDFSSLDEALASRHAAALRFEENHHRVEPCALDQARQLVRVRNEHQCTLDELAQLTGMSTTTAGLHLRCMKASDFLLTHAEEHRFPLTLIVELVRCEAQFGELSARKLVKAAAAGEHTAASLARHRAEVRNGKKAAVKKRAQDTVTRSTGTIVNAYRKDPATYRAAVVAAIQRLQEALADGDASPDTSRSKAPAA